MKWIRWHGIIIFAVMTAITVGVWFLSADSLVKSAVESAGAAAVGAKVEVAEADLSFVPLGITIRGLQITNPDDPMTNAVEIERMAFLMDGGRLMLRKVIVDEMALEGVKLNTQRKRSGAISRPKEAEKAADSAGSSIKMPEFKVPDAKELLKSEELESLKLYEKLKSDMDSRKKKWEERIAALPGDDKVKDYERRIKEIEKAAKGDAAKIASALADAAKLKSEIEADLKNAKSAVNEFGPELKGLKAELESAARAPMKDVERIKSKYGLSAEGMGNLSRMFLGPEVGGWVDSSLSWYKRLSPLVEGVADAGKDKPKAVKPLRGKGLDIKFMEREPLPDFLVREAKASVVIEAGTINGLIKNITNDQPALGKPLVFEFGGKGLKGLGSLSVTGLLDHTKAGKSRDELKLRASGYELKSMDISSSKEMPIKLDSAKADMDAMVSLASSGGLSARADVKLSGAQFSAPVPDDASIIARSAAEAIAGVTSLTLRAEAKGTTESYDLSMSSNLDSVLKDALGKSMSAMSKQFESELTKAIEEKTGGKLSELQAEIKGFDSISTALNAKQSSLSGLLSDATKAGSSSGGGLLKGLKLPF